MTRPQLVRSIALITAGLVALAGCARGDSPGADPQPSDGANAEEFVSPGVYRQDGGGEPVKGGTLTFAEYAETRSLDPTKTIPTGSSGGSSLVAIYDQLFRFNQETGEYEPRLAESVEPNADSSEWTVKLRPGVTFSDGSDLNADAVLGSVGYYMQNQGYDLGVIYPMWKGVEKVDDMTVVFRLKGSWATFDDMLGRGMGFILAPAAYSGGEFTPIGAGAFTLENYAPGESLTFVPNPTHWDGVPYIEQLRFVWLGNDETKIDSFNAGSVHGAYVRKPGLVKKLRDEGRPGAISLQNGGNILMLNAAEGRPLAVEKARRAMALAIDPTQIYERAHDGMGLPGKSLFSTASTWYAEDVEVNDYDLAEAKRLLAEAREEGFSGTVGYTGLEDPTAREEAMVIKGQLEAAGFAVELDMVRTVADFITKIFIEKNYDVGKAGIQVTENDPYYDLFSVFHSQSAANVLGNNDPELDKLIEELRQATPEEAADVTRRIEERYQAAVPAISLGSNAPMSVWAEEVHDIQVTNEDMLDFSEAWIKE